MPQNQLRSLREILTDDMIPETWKNIHPDRFASTLPEIIAVDSDTASKHQEKSLFTMLTENPTRTLEGLGKVATLGAAMFAPGVSQLVSGKEAISGENITEQYMGAEPRDLASWERMLAGAAVLPFGGLLKGLGVPRLMKALAILEPSMKGKILIEEIRKLHKSESVAQAGAIVPGILSRRRGQILTEGLTTPQSEWTGINAVKGEPSLADWGQYRPKSSTIVLGPGARAGTWQHEVLHKRQDNPAGGAEEYLMSSARSARDDLRKIQRLAKDPKAMEKAIYQADPWEVHARMFENVKGLNTAEKFTDYYQRTISPAMTESAYLIKKMAEDFPESAIPLRSVAADIRQIGLDADEAYRISRPQTSGLFRTNKFASNWSNETFSLKAEREGIGSLSAGKGTAEFLGWQERLKGDPIALYNITGGSRHGSTVTEETLKELGIEVPKALSEEESLAKIIRKRLEGEGQF